MTKSGDIQGFDPKPGQALALAVDIALVLAPNASPMTYKGTNSYVIGTNFVVVIDPGPDDTDHLNALLRAIGDRPVTHILVTHSHLDHSPLARKLSDATHAPVCAFGGSDAGRSAVMTQLSDQGLVGGGEGIDHAFRPDITLADGDVLETPSGPFRAIHTPGHIGNHLCFAFGNKIFTGDHIMGWASSLVSPPDGDLTDFMASCEKLKRIEATRYYPGHGGPIDEPKARLDWLINHRKTREAQILAAMAKAEGTARMITQRVYTDVSPALLPAAERNVLAHLVDLHERGKIRATPQLGIGAAFGLVPNSAS